MIIRNNIPALSTLRQGKVNQTSLQKSLEKLSSGLRINKSSDDAAGLAISEKMRGQIRGLNQAARNIQDGISLIQTAEGAMSEVHGLLQRGRELSVQASNDTYTMDDRKKIQLEIDNIIEEIDGISERTEFNRIKLLRGQGISAPPPASGGGSFTPAQDTSYGTDAELSEALNDYMLNTTVQMISNYYGISPKSDTELDVVFETQSPGGAVAWVSSMVNTTTGEAQDFKLVLDKADFFNDDGLWISKDRIVAHEMVHAVMGASGMNMLDSAMPKWFKEGAAEYLPGADERLEGSVLILGDSQDVIDYLSGPYNSSHFYSAGYAAVKYLDDQIQMKTGGVQSIKNVMQILADGNLKTLDTTLKELTDSSGIKLYSNGLTSFLNDFKDNGAAFIDSLVANGEADGVGSISGSADDINVVSDASNPVSSDFGFDLVWTSSTGYSPSTNPMISILANSFDDTGILKFQAGANENQSIDVKLSVIDSASLGVVGADVLHMADNSISTFEQAIETVSRERTRLGAIQNRLESALNVNQINSENTQAAESRIRDVNMAKEMAAFTRENILVQAAQSMLAQANQQPQSVLQLLR
jgi:flagellin